MLVVHTFFSDSAAQRREEGARCGERCAEATSKLHKRNQELQRHLEKACRQLQTTVREHPASLQRLRGNPPGTHRLAGRIATASRSHQQYV